jgi:hypothetical protein
VRVQAGDTAAHEAEDGMDPVVRAGGLGFTGDQGPPVTGLLSGLVLRDVIPAGRAVRGTVLRRVR